MCKRNGRGFQHMEIPARTTEERDKISSVNESSDTSGRGTYLQNQ